MKNKNYIKQLLMEHKPIKVYIDNDDFGIFKYNEKNQRYVGQFGYIHIKDVIRVLNEDPMLDFIKIEGV